MTMALERKTVLVQRGRVRQIKADIMRKGDFDVTVAFDTGEESITFTTDSEDKARMIAVGDWVTVTASFYDIDPQTA